MKFLWILVAICSIIGALVFFILLAGAESSIHEATAAGIGIAIAAIPYCLVRAIAEYKAEDRRQALETQRTLEAMRRSQEEQRRLDEEQRRRNVDYQRLREEERQRQEPGQ